MGIQEEKEWLRAILEGRVKPGDTDWQRVCMDTDFAGLRRRLRLIGEMGLEERQADLQAIWRNIESVRNKNRAVRRLRILRRVAYSAACIAGLAVSAAIFFLKEKTEDTAYVLPPELAWGQSVMLTLPNGEKQILPQNDTAFVLTTQEERLHVNSRTLIMAEREKEREPVYYTMNVPYGAEYKLWLPDGTKICLNAGSVLRYPDYFAGSTREIYLSGEAYLEVAKDSARPFIVRTKEISVRVLGTVFNVNAYPDADYIRTTLVEGKVETLCGAERIEMQPGTQVAYDKRGKKSDYFPVDVHLYTSWKDGYYDFEGMALSELMQILSRWYDVKVEFAEPSLRNLKFSGRLKRYEDVRLLFERLEYTKDVTFTYENGSYVIRGKR